MNFSKALEALKNGDKVSRENWNGKNMWIEIQTPDNWIEIQTPEPYIFMKTVDGNLVPWLASQTDLLSNDWNIIIDN